MNFKKVEAYMKAKIEEYKEYYPTEIFEDLKIGVGGGSFGACLISLKNNFYSFDCSYVGNYSAIDGKISDFIVRSYERLAEKAYQREREENKKGMAYKLTIYNDNKIVNTLESSEARTVKNELIKIMIADKRRGVKTTYKPIPYSNNMTIIQKWDKETAHLSHNVKYVYEFKNIDY